MMNNDLRLTANTMTSDCSAQEKPEEHRADMSISVDSTYVFSKGSQVDVSATRKIPGDFSFPPEDLEVRLDFHGRDGFSVARNCAEKGSRQSETCIDIIILRHVLDGSVKMFSTHTILRNKENFARGFHKLLFKKSAKFTILK